MRICIPTNESSGESASVAAYFGTARYYTLLDADTGEIEVVENVDRDHGTGGCRPLRQLRGKGVDTVVCDHVGRNAMRLLEELGIAAFAAPGVNVATVMLAAREGRLRESGPPVRCGGRDRDAGLSRGAGRGRGDGRDCGGQHGGGRCGGRGQGRERRRRRHRHGGGAD